MSSKDTSKFSGKALFLLLLLFLFSLFCKKATDIQVSKQFFIKIGVHRHANSELKVQQVEILEENYDNYIGIDNPYMERNGHQWNEFKALYREYFQQEPSKVYDSKAQLQMVLLCFYVMGFNTFEVQSSTPYSHFDNPVPKVQRKQTQDNTFVLQMTRKIDSNLEGKNVVKKIAGNDEDDQLRNEEEDDDVYDGEFVDVYDYDDDDNEDLPRRNDPVIINKKIRNALRENTLERDPEEEEEELTGDYFTVQFVVSPGIDKGEFYKLKSKASLVTKSGGSDGEFNFYFRFPVITDLNMQKSVKFLISKLSNDQYSFNLISPKKISSISWYYCASLEVPDFPVTCYHKHVIDSAYEVFSLDLTNEVDFGTFHSFFSYELQR